MREDVHLLVHEAQDAIFVDEHGAAPSRAIGLTRGFIQNGKVAASIRQQRKVEVKRSGKGDLPLLAFCGVNRYSPDFRVACGKGESLITERRKMIRSAAGEALGEKRQQQILLSAQIAQAPHAPIHIRNRKIRRRLADFKFWCAISQAAH